MMNDYSADYNHAEAIKSIKSLLAVISVAYLCVITVWLTRSAGSSADYVALTIGTAAIFVLLWNRGRRHRNGNRKITLHGEYLSIPALFFFDKVIPVSKLCSVMPINDFGGLWLGVRNKQAYILYERRFVRREDFLLLAGILQNLIQQNLSVEERKIQSLIGSEAKVAEVALMLMLIAVWVVLYLQSSAGANYYEIGDGFLVAGANTRGILASQEYYRLFSSFFLHGTVLHLLLNITVFSQFGHALIRMIGIARFLTILLFSSLAGTVASTIYSPYAMSIGASGGLYGLFAAYLYLKAKFTNYLPAAINAVPMTWLIGILCVDLFCALFIFTRIDVVNHVSGFAAGYCWCLLTHPGLKVLQPVRLGEVLLCGGLVTLYGYGLVVMLVKIAAA